MTFAEYRLTEDSDGVKNYMNNMMDFRFKLMVLGTWYLVIGNDGFKVGASAQASIHFALEFL